MSRVKSVKVVIGELEAEISAGGWKEIQKLSIGGGDYSVHKNTVL